MPRLAPFVEFQMKPVQEVLDRRRQEHRAHGREEHRAEPSATAIRLLTVAALRSRRRTSALREG